VNPGLVFLLRRSAIGRARLLLRQARTTKGALTLLAFALLLALIVLPQLADLAGGGGRTRSRMDAGWLRLLAPVALMLFSGLAASSGQALAFRPAEIGFLFPAPISRRQLLLYHLCSRVGVQVLSGLFMAIFLLPHAPLPAIGMVAAIMAAVFLHVVAQFLAVLQAAVTQRVGDRIGRWRLPALAVAALGAAALIRNAVPRGAEPAEMLRLVAGSPLVQFLTLPARPVVEFFLARDAVSVLQWGGASLGVLAGAVAGILFLDVAITEHALESSRKVAERLQRVRQGGGSRAVRSGRSARLPVPRLAFLGPAAPLAGRQLQELARNPRSAITMLAVTIVWLALVVGVPILNSLREGLPVSAAAGWTALAAALLAPLVLAAQLTHDFRRDIDRMPLLKSLPLRPRDVAIGQLFTGTLVCASVQIICAGLVVAFTGVLSWPAYLALVLALPTLAWTFVAVENATFLLMPYRALPGTGDGTPFMGRVMIVFLVKMLVIALLLVVAALLGGLVWATSGGNPLLAAGAVFVALAAGCIPLTWLVARAFVAFDVATDVPA
jgi:ABC-2 type transport system permease protein